MRINASHWIFALFFWGGAYAADITSFKILGVKLGDQYRNIEKKLPCKNKSAVAISGAFDIGCKNNSDVRNEEVKFSFDRSGKVIEIRRKILFSVVPDWRQVHDSLVAEYGEPDETGIQTYKRRSGHALMGCYGSCRRNEGEGVNIGGVSLYNGDGYSLLIVEDRIEVSDRVPELSISLVDGLASRKEGEYQRVLRDEADKQKMQNLSKIKF